MGKNKRKKKPVLFFFLFTCSVSFKYIQVDFVSIFLQMGSSYIIIGCRINRAVHSTKVYIESANLLRGSLLPPAIFSAI